MSTIAQVPSMITVAFLLAACVNITCSCDSYAAEGMSCDIQHGPCSFMSAAGMSIEFDVQPKPVTAMSECLFIVILHKNRRPVSDATVSLDLSMPGMFMGKNQPVLKHIGSGRYEGKGIITKCASGKKTWRADVIIGSAGKADTAGFIFEVR